ncbi:MAG: aminoacyl-histidine dipeptidase [Bacteroidales bacterium]|jgi:dipeptidase D|nr:aminoacyl-histidine dipeptidase [Bacteroidales bacterium]
MNEEVKGLKPQKVFGFFAQILAIPRPSKKEEKMTEFLYNWGISKGLETIKDKAGNVLIRKSATKGFENKASVCLQSHIDMVCEKNSDKVFDFEKDTIEAYIDNGWLKAKGTTLGADDGIGVATALAILDSDDIEHGDIECLFTTDEETGLSGAEALSPELIKSRILINLDSEDEGEIFIGCAGGRDTVAKMRYDKEDFPVNASCLKISVKGLKGGHSGDDINKGLACANKVLNRILWVINRNYDIRLSSFDGGNLRNAIAREAFAVLAVLPQDVESIKNDVKKISNELCYEFRTTEPSMAFTIEEVSKPKFIVDMLTQDDLFNVLFACPHGVLAMSREIPNFVETSTNLASVKMDDEFITVTTSQRSSVKSALDAACNRINACFTLVGADIWHGDGYPGWTPNPNSKILKVAEESYERIFEKKPVVRAIHAGLECGLIGEKYKGMDMISYGPTLRGVHSPDERLEIATVEMFWQHTLDILKNVPENKSKLKT